MGWIKWHTPSREQSVVITLESRRDTLLLLDENGNQCDKLTINADIAKVKESTPPDPLVSDTKPQMCCSRSLTPTVTAPHFITACLKNRAAVLFSRRINIRLTMTRFISRRSGSRTGIITPSMSRFSTCGVRLVSFL